MRKELILAISIGISGLTANGEYTLKMKNGNFPEGVTIQNVNGNIPKSSAYKKGWTDQGWGVNNYDRRSDVAISPSYLEGEGECESALTLPSMTILEGEWLRWEGCEVYPLYKDSYSVEIRKDGNETWEVIGEFTETESTWTKHMIDLSQYAGIDVEVRFVCRSSEGYMLSLSNISISKPTEYSFDCANYTPKFFAAGELEEGCGWTEFAIMNTGKEITSAVVSIEVGKETVVSDKYGNKWETGETRIFRMPLPLTRNLRSDYSITITPDNNEKLTIGESFAYCTSFKRHLFVDKGTGMWCNACPEGTLAMERLKMEYGDAIISVETHEGDPLANDIDFTWLKFYSIPQLELNRIKSTKGSGSEQFKDHICVPTEMEVNITGLRINSDGTLTADATVSTSEDFAAVDKTYRIGYMLTRNVSGYEDIHYYQKNICTLASNKQYYYLPSRILYNLCYYHDVSIPSPTATDSDNVAFTGIQGSLPENLNAGETYSCSWDIPLPDGFSDFHGIRLVAYILDAGSRTIENSCCEDIDKLAAIEEIFNEKPCPRNGYIYSVDGRMINTDRSKLAPGLYIIDGKKTLIKR